ncbi:MAG: polysaccharide biosynthesis C-terminal domain-containing protein [Methanobrevibacter sp.]|jgi:Na+-driven multidrug efflux pump|nr:polysaccharide biosynthesis C-terminal domain-containing protein [Candidatus Methanoflexus mossambicus]
MFERKYNLLNSKFRQFFWPTLFLTASLNLSSICDSLIIGNLLGSNALAATVLCVPITIIYTAIEMTLGFGGSTMATISKANRNMEKSKQIFTVSIISLLVISILIAIVGNLFLGDLSNLLVQGNQSLLPLVENYLEFLLLGAPFMLLPLGFSYFIRAEGKPNTATLVFIVANVVNVIFDIILIKFLNMGIAGGSLSTVIGYAVGMIFVVKYLISKDRVTKFSTNLSHKFQILKEIIISGLSPASGQIFMFLKIFFINSLVLIVLGNPGAVAVSLCFDMLLIVSIVISGVCESFSPIVAVLYGEKDNNGIKFIMKRSVIIAVGFSLVFMIVILLFPDLIAQLYGIKSSIDLVVASEALRLFSLSFCGVAISFIMLFYTQTIMRNKLSFFISAFEGLVLIVPLVYIFSYLFGGVGIWLAFLVTEVITIALIIIFTKIISKTSKNKFNGILLLEQDEDVKSFDLTVKSSSKDVVKVSEDLINFSRENGLDEKTSMYLGLAFEEMMVNTIEYNNGFINDKMNKIDESKIKDKNSSLEFIDILVKIGVNEVILSFKDSGIEFDPTEYSSEDDSIAFTNIDVLKKISESISYARVLGLNSTVITLKR